MCHEGPYQDLVDTLSFQGESLRLSSSVHGLSFVEWQGDLETLEFHSRQLLLLSQSKHVKCHQLAILGPGIAPQLWDDNFSNQTPQSTSTWGNTMPLPQPLTQPKLFPLPLSFLFRRIFTVDDLEGNSHCILLVSSSMILVSSVQIPFWGTFLQLSCILIGFLKSLSRFVTSKNIFLPTMLTF